MIGESVDNGPEMLPDRCERSSVGADDERVSAGLKSPTRTIRVPRCAINELPDGLVKGLPKRRADNSAELETVFGLDEDVASALCDRTEVVHLLAGLPADLLYVGRVHTPGGRQRNPGYQVRGQPGESARLETRTGGTACPTYRTV
jgi:hypothetical protein